MEKIIYQDDNGLYYVDYDEKGNPLKVYCDEKGNPLENLEEDAALEIFQQEDGTYYYVAYNELGEAYKVPCDENGNEIVEPLVTEAPVYTAPQPAQENLQQEPAAFAGAVGAATAYPNQVNNGKKSSKILGILAGLLIAILLAAGGYFAYSKFIAKPVVNVAGYVVDVKFSGKDGEGKAEGKITSIPDVRISDTSKQQQLDELLTNAEISYSKNSGLKNGDKIAVNVNVDSAAAESLGVKLEGTFRKSYEVEGLGTSSSNDSSSSSKDDSKEDSKDDKSDDKKSEDKKLEYKQVYNTGSKGLLMRTGPSQSHPAITTLFDGTPVKILEYEGSWAKVDYNGTQGWMYTGFLR